MSSFNKAMQCKKKNKKWLRKVKQVQSELLLFLIIGRTLTHLSHVTAVSDCSLETH